jgi:hypothetical protein
MEGFLEFFAFNKVAKAATDVGTMAKEKMVVDCLAGS